MHACENVASVTPHPCQCLDSDTLEYYSDWDESLDSTTQAVSINPASKVHHYLCDWAHTTPGRSGLGDADGMPRWYARLNPC